jgi:hypothetical protein
MVRLFKNRLSITCIISIIHRDPTLTSILKTVIVVIRLTRVCRVLPLRVLIVIVIGVIWLAVASVVIITIHFAAAYYRLQI